MDCISIYKCLCDVTRLRILNLLREGPLCVCHLHEILEEPQPKISKQLNYMKRFGLLRSERRGNWTIYRIPAEPEPLLTENLKCLQDATFQTPDFLRDISRLQQTDTSAACSDLPAACCESDSSPSKSTPN